MNKALILSTISMTKWAASRLVYGRSAKDTNNSRQVFTEPSGCVAPVPAGFSFAALALMGSVLFHSTPVLANNAFEKSKHPQATMRCGGEFTIAPNTDFSRNTRYGQARSLKISNARNNVSSVTVSYFLTAFGGVTDATLVLAPGETRYINTDAISTHPLEARTEVSTNNFRSRVRVSEWSENCSPLEPNRTYTSSCFHHGFGMHVRYKTNASVEVTLDTIRYEGTQGYERTAALWQLGWLFPVFYDPAEKRNLHTEDVSTRPPLYKHVVPGGDFTMSVWTGAGHAKTCRFTFDRSRKPIVTKLTDDWRTNVGWYTWLSKR